MNICVGVVVCVCLYVPTIQYHSGNMKLRIKMDVIRQHIKYSIRAFNQCSSRWKHSQTAWSGLNARCAVDVQLVIYQCMPQECFHDTRECRHYIMFLLGWATKAHFRLQWWTNVYKLRLCFYCALLCKRANKKYIHITCGEVKCDHMRCIHIFMSTILSQMQNKRWWKWKLWK